MKSSQYLLEVDNLTKSFKVYDKRWHLLLDVIFHTSKYKKKTVIENLSFKIKRGETFGIIGGNQSGKTTLLRILDGVVPKTSGTIKFDGTAVRFTFAAGMSESKTGRENIFYRLGLMGYKKEEIKVIVENIIADSELKADIDVQYKYYSTAMRNKLAYAMLINLKPDLILADERLTVGDVKYKQQSFKQINDLKRQGKSVLITSASPDTISNLCERVVWIEEGVQVCSGNAKKISDLYRKYINGELSLEQIKRGLKVGIYDIH